MGGGAFWVQKFLGALHQRELNPTSLEYPLGLTRSPHGITKKSQKNQTKKLAVSSAACVLGRLTPRSLQRSSYPEHHVSPQTTKVPSQCSSLQVKTLLDCSDAKQRPQRIRRSVGLPGPGTLPHGEEGRADKALGGAGGGGWAVMLGVTGVWATGKRSAETCLEHVRTRLLLLGTNIWFQFHHPCGVYKAQGEILQQCIALNICITQCFLYHMCFAKRKFCVFFFITLHFAWSVQYTRPEMTFSTCIVRCRI